MVVLLLAYGLQRFVNCKQSKTRARDLFVCLLLFFATATVCQLYHAGDMMYEMRRSNPKPTLLLTQGICNLSHDISMGGMGL